MPNGNGKGPRGAGAMTGRGKGFCNGSSAPGWKHRDAIAKESEEQSRSAEPSPCRGPLGCGVGRGQPRRFAQGV